MCYEDGKLLEYLDGECAPEERQAVKAHLATCADCAAALVVLESDRQFAAAALASLQPKDAPCAPPVVEATPAVAGRRRPAVVERFGWGRVAAAAAALVFAASFAFAPVRGLAADVLRIFRVQKIQTISLTQADMDRIGEALSKGEGKIDLASLGEIDLVGSQPSPEETTLEAAQKAVDFELALPKGIEGTRTVQLQKPMTAAFKLKVDAVNQMLELYGSEKLLPREVDGKAFTFKVPAIVTVNYEVPGSAAGDPDDPGAGPMEFVMVGAARSPELVVPDGVDPLALREVIVNLPFLPDNIRRQLAGVDDWQNTMLIPTYGTNGRDITIKGVPAVIMVENAGAGPASQGVQGYATVIWNQDGVIRVISGSMTEKQAIAYAESMMR